MTRRNLRAFRVRNGLTQAEMAARLGVTRANYSLVETGKQGLSVRLGERIQREFGVPDEEMWSLIKETE